ncbi:Carbon monoxide dehydrogenase subunit G OS=Sphingobium scionense OX=1404341 GN=GGQ90_004002 PE=4 SV=1 [Sphingobium scionense]|nr:Calx-beta domain-containing protein [Sphingobium scionense]
MTKIRFAILAGVCLGGSVYAAETTTFSYDALGRLVATSNSGGPRNGKQTSTEFDEAGNRKRYSKGTPGAAPTNNISFSVASVGAVNEGQSSVFTITKSAPWSVPLTVNYATANGTAVAPGDYTATSGTLTFKGWETVKTVSVPTIVDTLAEGAEQFSLALSSPSGGSSLGTVSAAGTINASSAPNQPPTTVTDTMAVKVCMSAVKNVVANDTDPEGNYPLTVVSVTSTTKGDTYVVDASSIGFTAYGSTGNAQVTYTVKDSLGATATGTLAITITSGTGCS